MAEFTPQEQEEFEFRMRMEQEQQQAAPQQEAPNPNAVSASTNEILIPAAGAAAGAAARKLPEQFANMVKDPITGKWMALENYGRQMAGGKWYGGKHMGDVYERIVAAGADPAVAAKYEAEALQKMGKGSQLGAKLTSKLPDFVKPLATAPMGMLGRGLVGVGAGMQGADALNRYNEGDTSGAIISGIGGLATAASMIPHPVARIGGTAVGLGAEGLNMFLDKLKNKKKMAHGGLVDEEDGLSKAEKAALKIMKKKKVKHFFLGGSVSSSIGPAIGAYPGAPTMGGSMSPVDPVATPNPQDVVAMTPETPMTQNPNGSWSPTVDPTGPVNYSNPNTGGLSGLLAGNSPTAPLAPTPYTPMPATLAEWQAQQGPAITADVKPWAGTVDASGTWKANPDQAAAYAAYAAQQNATNGPKPISTPAPIAGGGLSSIMPVKPTVKPPVVKPTVNPPVVNPQLPPSSPVAAATLPMPKIDFRNAIKPNTVPNNIPVRQSATSYNAATMNPYRNKTGTALRKR